MLAKIFSIKRKYNIQFMQRKRPFVKHIMTKAIEHL
jgi:hypothetical protein